MSDECAKRFLLALADLVREPRKPASRADASRGKGTGVTDGVAKSPAKLASVTQPGSSKSASGAAKPVPAATQRTSHATHTVHTSHARPSALRTAPRGAERDLNAASVATKKGASNVALASVQTLTSERVRERMVERLRGNGVTDLRVLNAMSVVPCHMFVDLGLAAQAYEDALPIGHHQTISKPSVVARMIELVATGRPLEKVLEIGTGCGYQAAVLSQVAREVYSIERVRPLSERAKLNLQPLRVPNIRLHYGDGRLGLWACPPPRPSTPSSRVRGSTCRSARATGHRRQARRARRIADRAVAGADAHDAGVGHAMAGIAARSRFLCTLKIRSDLNR
ncbi:Protein-L-isoaspartate O-methyltransferase [Candidatus Paraburkholderia calva]|nr:Protein-L-isoaspartate O-methyltransferase [Candidatus Paraburkholderia calva]